jgi:diacylglycerol kinase (ATP)
MLALNRLQLPNQRIILRIRDFRRIQNVIQMLMMPDRFPKLISLLLNRHFDIIGDSTGPKIISHPLQRIAIVYNPSAGGLRGSKRTRLDAAIEAFRRAGRDVELFPTTGPNMAGELGCVAIDKGFNLLLAAGGDGTINEVLNGIVGSKIAFGVLPAGTANVLAKEIGLACRPDRAASELLDAVTLRVPVGKAELADSPPRYFLMMAGVGLDARIVHELDLTLKRKLGKLAYWHGGFSQMGRDMPKLRIVADGVERVASFALLARVRNYGGDFEIARNVRLTDTDFEVVIYERHGWLAYLTFFSGVIFNRLGKLSGVTIVRAKRATLTPVSDAPVHVQADGEAIGLLPGVISVVPDAITLLLPKRYAKA